MGILEGQSQEGTAWSWEWSFGLCGLGMQDAAGDGQRCRGQPKAPCLGWDNKCQAECGHCSRGIREPLETLGLQGGDKPGGLEQLHLGVGNDEAGVEELIGPSLPGSSGMASGQAPLCKGDWDCGWMLRDSSG